MKWLKIIAVSVVFVCLWQYDVSAQDWKEYRTRHFAIFYDESPMEFVKSVEDMAEYHYDSISDTLGFKRYKNWSYDDRAKIYIYNDSEHYVKAGGQAGWSHGSASPSSKVIRTFPTAHGFFDSTLPHEIAHIVFREQVGFRANVPLWFEEGVAMYTETAKRFGAHKQVKEYIDAGAFIPLEQLSMIRFRTRSSQQYIQQFYTQSASIINYLINEHGKHRFVRLCRKLEEGGPFEWALKSIYPRFRDMEALNKAWVNYLEKKN